MKASSNRAIMSLQDGPKPGELTMDRVSPVERREEARTRRCCKNVRRSVVRGNMPNEPGDSWFSPKYI